MVRPADPPEVLERFHRELDLVDIIARQVSKTIGKLVEFDDLLSCGREGLLDAARRFDPARNVPFRTYANYRVRGAMFDGVRKMAALPRRAYERLAALEAALIVSEGEADCRFFRADSEMSDGEADEALGNTLALTATASAISMLAEVRPVAGTMREEEPESPEQMLERAELFAYVERELAELNKPREAEVVRLHYLEGLTMEAIAEELETDKSWASRLHTRAIKRLTKRLKRLV